MAKRVIVIGSGIIGASIAWHLAKAGAEVTVIEAGGTGGLATRASWAWINASWGNPEPYFRLRLRSIDHWHRMQSEIGGLAINWCGGLIWDLPPAELDAHAAERAQWGQPLRRLRREEIHAVEPNLRQLPDYGYFAAGEGMLEPLATARTLLSAASAAGADVISGMPVKWLAEEHGRVTGVMTDEGVIHADETVVAAGANTAQLLDSVGITLRMSAPAGLLSHSKPAPKLLNGLVMTPGLHIRQTAEGRIVAGADFAGADPEGNAEALAADLQAKVGAMVEGAEGLGLAFFTVGYRPTPADGFSAIGRPHGKNGLYLVVTHSGVTLAAALGLFAAQELLNGTRDPLLATFSPDRPSLA
ncbi:FAD-binding oxidoreductase [Aestuariivirga sp.]|uniref:NAD(P)/FAD-dependent oxidoreductase n=1 Tax=Aestuariivirga sp. TaxID=2650926 RepID=UPI0025BB7C11|nr:FAD-binding oxidoreductase [Aestuariivirga sp.]MCA3555059.1 FAD-binding oxidoreductase [Aestuariivirga sp.]